MHHWKEKDISHDNDNDKDTHKDKNKDKDDDIDNDNDKDKMLKRPIGHHKLYFQKVGSSRI